MPEPFEGRARRAFTVAEVLIAAAVFVVLTGLVVYMLMQGRRSSQTLGTQMSLAQASRKTLVKLLGELREGMEVLSPRPGSTKAQALIRDKLSFIRWYALHPRSGSSPEVYELWRYINDPDLTAARRAEMLLGGIKRLRFTCLSEGILQVNLTLIEEGKEYSILTTVHLHNLPSAEAVW
jgi:hypothetical protein